ncbi:MAG: toll/interleukin-1 receptor domain-containing protein [Chloroflexi bacterium]|nr:MAG: toll/interleukin-1 receptor domain-containing protein [Chloroflexota bacterium]
MSAQPTPIEVFYSYASEDEALRYELEKHLSLLHRQGLISSWHHRQIVAGTERLKEVDKYLETASIILLLISSDFLASDYCYSIEMQRALERHRLGKAHVIPVFLRTTDWENAPFTHLQGLPSNGKAVTTWDDRDLAFTDFSPLVPPILIFALASCLIIALQTGWLACLRHYLLRWLLWLNGSIPWNYVQFLDYAAKRLLLRKAGGGYIFMHRLLLDYLASLDISLLEKERSALSTARENTPPNLSQASVVTQRKNAGHKGVIVFIEIILLLALTCGVSLFGQVQQHASDIASTATTNAYANAYATADSATATATAIVAHNSYFSFLSRMGTPAFIDPLSQENSSRWSSYSTGSTRACQFTGGAYHVSQQTNKYVMGCNATGTFSNFAFEVQLAITRGDCGGMAFRSDSKGHLYVFRICQNGTYSVIKCVSNNGSDAETLAGSNSPAIHTGLGQQNKIAIEASGGTITFYVNEQQIDQVQDSSYVSGSLGLIAYPESNTPTDVAYSNAKLWTL